MWMTKSCALWGANPHKLSALRFTPCSPVSALSGAEGWLSFRIAFHDRLPNPPQISGLFRAKRPQGSAFVLASPAELSHTAVHQRGDEPVQRRLPRPRKA